ncbi:hypothetical protein BV20DRAFT_974435 [Pilatotrama ljubarskyi]|nr:hypothetical protein BV20DRAFT_974435 [Pilatotrama ljubarskyi]
MARRFCAFTSRALSSASLGRNRVCCSLHPLHLVRFQVWMMSSREQTTRPSLEAMGVHSPGSGVLSRIRPI